MTEPIRFTLTRKTRSTFLPVAAQIMLAARSKRHDKRNTRTKQKRSWQNSGCTM